MPRVHRVASLLKRWLMGTHQGAVMHEHLDFYLDEFTFRFNRRRSQRGCCFLALPVVVRPVASQSTFDHRFVRNGIDGSRNLEVSV